MSKEFSSIAGHLVKRKNCSVVNLSSCIFAFVYVSVEFWWDGWTDIDVWVRWTFGQMVGLSQSDCREMAAIIVDGPTYMQSRHCRWIYLRPICKVPEKSLFASTKSYSKEPLRGGNSHKFHTIPLSGCLDKFGKINICSVWPNLYHIIFLKPDVAKNWYFVSSIMVTYKNKLSFYLFYSPHF